MLAGCSIYQEPVVPRISHPAQFVDKSALTNVEIKQPWWENFNDPTLNGLVALALKNNYDYKVALKNIEIAATYIDQNVSGLYPQLNLNYSSTRNRAASTSSTAFTGQASNKTIIYNSNQLEGTVSYQLDVWRQVRNSVKQAVADLQASEAQKDVVKLSLISSVTNAYLQFIAAKVNLANLQEQLQTAQEFSALLKTQQVSGLIDQSAVDSADIQVEQIQIEVSALQNQQQIYIYTLAYLLGEYPEHFNLALPDNWFKILKHNQVPSGIPSLVIARRPDIQAAYHQVWSYGYAEKQSLANFLPNISLTGDFGYSSTMLGKLLHGPSSFWNFGIAATQYVFDYKLRSAEYERSKLQYQSAILNYRSTVLNAFNEIDSALTTYKQDRQALISYKKQTALARDALELSKTLYKSGLNDYTGCLTNKLSYMQAAYNMTNQQLAVAMDAVQVYITMGLGL